MLVLNLIHRLQKLLLKDTQIRSKADRSVSDKAFSDDFLSHNAFCTWFKSPL
ncbi:hypothetical protein LguiA_022054 [Lonicera macranthoides]